MDKKYLTLDNVSSYKNSFDLSNEIWFIAVKWDYFSKDTVGKQLVRAADSVSANIAEGFGRYSKKDKIKFYRISIGSLEESCDWINKAFVRELLTEQQKNTFLNSFLNLKKEIYQLINFTQSRLKI